MPSPDIEISTDPARIDMGVVHGYLSRSYWAEGRSRATIERCIEHSFCFGAYHRDRQIAFGRVITDFAVFAYLADIFVVAEYRAQGVGKALVRAIVEHPRLRGVQVMLLRTRDAHGLYKPFGFDAAPRPEELMVRYAPPGI